MVTKGPVIEGLLYLISSCYKAVVSVEDAESQVVGVLDHQPNQESIVTDVIGFDDHLQQNTVKTRIPDN